MQEDVYRLNFEAEDNHWWFLGRRRILESVLKRFARADPRPGVRVLDFGCGTGGNFALLSEYGSILGVDMSDEALAYSRTRGMADLIKINSLDETPRGPFPLIACLDVLEHIPDDLAALRTLRERLAPDGIVLIAVPAYNWLWSGEDTVSQHVRRYTRRVLVQRCREAGFGIHYASYFNTLLFPLVAATIGFNRIFRPQRMHQSDVRPSVPWVNRLLSGAFGLERCWLRFGAFPAGASILMVCGIPDSPPRGAHE